MAQITATRSALLARRAQLALAAQGRDILERKRDQLLEEFRRTADIVLSGAQELEQAAAGARQALAIAETEAGPENVRSLASAAGREFSLESTPTSIMGLRIADIRHEPLGRGRAGRGYGLAGSGASVDDAAARFEAELTLLIDLATYELRLRRIVDEIGTTTRRVNALEHVVIPRLDRERAAIAAILEERERQDRFRLKRISAKTSARQALARGAGT